MVVTRTCGGLAAGHVRCIHIRRVATLQVGFAAFAKWWKYKQQEYRRNMRRKVSVLMRSQIQAGDAGCTVWQAGRLPVVVVVVVVAARQVRECFTLIDTDSSGFLDKEEVSMMMQVQTRYTVTTGWRRYHSVTVLPHLPTCSGCAKYSARCPSTRLLNWNEISVREPRITIHSFGGGASRRSDGAFL